MACLPFRPESLRGPLDTHHGVVGERTDGLHVVCVAVSHSAGHCGSLGTARISSVRGRELAPRGGTRPQARPEVETASIADFFDPSPSVRLLPLWSVGRAGVLRSGQCFCPFRTPRRYGNCKGHGTPLPSCAEVFLQMPGAARALAPMAVAAARRTIGLSHCPGLGGAPGGARRRSPAGCRLEAGTRCTA